MATLLASDATYTAADLPGLIQRGGDAVMPLVSCVLGQCSAYVPTPAPPAPTAATTAAPAPPAPAATTVVASTEVPTSGSGSGDDDPATEELVGGETTAAPTEAPSAATAVSATTPPLATFVPATLADMMLAATQELSRQGGLITDMQGAAVARSEQLRDLDARLVTMEAALRAFTTAASVASQAPGKVRHEDAPGHHGGGHAGSAGSGSGSGGNHVDHVDHTARALSIVSIITSTACAMLVAYSSLRGHHREARLELTEHHHTTEI